MWPMALRDDADSKGHGVVTEHGGGVYASSAAGQVTGFRAGHGTGMAGRADYR